MKNSDDSIDMSNINKKQAAINWAHLEGETGIKKARLISMPGITWDLYHEIAEGWAPIKEGYVKFLRDKCCINPDWLLRDIGKSRIAGCKPDAGTELSGMTTSDLLR